MRFPLFRSLLTVLVAGGTSVLAADAQPAPDAPLPEMVVTATRTEKAKEDVAQSLTVIGPEELQRQPERTVGDLLRDVPGLNLSVQANPGMKRVGIRGERPNRVLILIDGQKLTENKSMSGPPLLLTAASVERIEVIRGPGSVLYGSEAIGGVVNIITKKGGPRPVGGSVDYSYDSTTNGWATALSLAGSVGSFEYNLSGSLVDQGNRETPDGTFSDTGYEAREGSAYVGWREETFAVGVRYDNYRSEVGSYWGYPMSTPAYDLLDGAVDLPHWNRESVSAFLDIFDPLPHLERIHLDAYRQTTFKEFNQALTMSVVPFPVLMYQDVHTENDQDTLGLSLQLDWRFGDHLFTTGADWRRDDLGADTHSTTRFFTTTVSDSHDEATQSQFALFARDEWQFAEGWTAEFGIRNTWVRSELQDTTSTIAEGTTRDHRAVVSAALVNRSLADWTFRLGYSQGYRSPSLQELYTTSRTSREGYAIQPDPNLDPETIQSLEFGVRYAKGPAEVDATLFYAESKDFIATRQVSSTVYQWENLQSSRSFGLELAASYRYDLSERTALTPYLVGTAMRKGNVENGNTSYNTGIPRVQGRFGLRGNWDMAPEAHAWFDLFGRAADNARDDGPEPPVGYETTAGWATLNLELGYGWHQPVGNGLDWRISVGIENLFDRDYVVAGEWITAPGRSLFVKLGCTF